MTCNNTRVHRSANEKAKFVLHCLRSSQPISHCCREYGITESLYYKWLKSFVIGGTKELERKVSPRQSDASRVLTNHDKELLLLKSRFYKYLYRERNGHSYFSPTEKTHIIELVSNTNAPKGQVLQNIGVPRTSYHRWNKNIFHFGTTEKPNFGKPYVKIADRINVKEKVFEVLHSPPSKYGFNRTTWVFPELQKAIQSENINIGIHNIRKIIRDAGYRWLRAKKVLTSNDPDYREKLTKIHKILGNLKATEAFFSIDEYGPFAVKHRQGKKLVPPGQTFTVKQWQKSKGFLIITAALELSTNQVTHFYSTKKDTEEMIKLLDQLLGQYQSKDRIFLSWDAASWHISKKLFERIKENNKRAKSSGGPIVEVAPLPAGAQFLNVIESVFSGMARAIIHNSDYQSADEAKNAIDKHFRKRNLDFKINPKKAGNKIWGSERTPSKFSESQNCKDPRYR